MAPASNLKCCSKYLQSKPDSHGRRHSSRFIWVIAKFSGACLQLLQSNQSQTRPPGCCRSVSRSLGQIRTFVRREASVQRTGAARQPGVQTGEGRQQLAYKRLLATLLCPQPNPHFRWILYTFADSRLTLLTSLANRCRSRGAQEANPFPIPPESL